MTANNPIAFEQVDPANETVRVFRTEADLDRGAGEVVETPRGVGVVSAALTQNFDFPTTRGGETRVQASPETPAYIVGFGGRSAPYRASALTGGDLYNPRQNDRSATPLADLVAERGLTSDGLKTNWGKRDLLQWWSNAGGLWRSAREYIKREQGVGGDDARRMVSKRKDMVLGTDRWRTRF